jgi:hypothetical protein
VRRDRDDRAGKRVDDILRGLPYGKVVCVVRLVEIEETTFMLSEHLPRREQVLGNYDSGRYAWHLEMIDVIEPPVPAKGNRMLWNWNNKLERYNLLGMRRPEAADSLVRFLSRARL